MTGDTAEALRCGHELLALDRARGSDAATALGNLVDAELAAGDAAAAARSGTELVAQLKTNPSRMVKRRTCPSVPASSIAFSQRAPCR